MPLTKVLIVVKTYPTLSDKYDELVCTAGFLEDGTWVRIYPVPFRKKSYDEQYKKYDWIELDIVKNTKDFRPESFRPRTEDSNISIVGHVDTKNNWQERKRIVLGKIYQNLTELISEAKNEQIRTSLAVFKPSEVLDFIIEEEKERTWGDAKLAHLRQYNLFESAQGERFEVVRKLPYKYSYHFKDNQGKESKLMIEDWELGQLYWKCLEKHKGNEEKANIDVRQKYFFEFVKTKELYFFLGTTKKFHSIAHNPFIIIGTFYPKTDLQMKMF